MVTKKTATEQVPGLQQAPVEGGKFVVRKVKEQESPEGTPGAPTANATYTRELVLVIDGEDEYTIPLYTIDDGTLNNATYQLIQQRREKLREKLFEDNDEVELTA